MERIRGGNGIVDGRVDDVNWTDLMETMERKSFRHLEEANASEGIVGEDPRFTITISREKYANMYGPTTGDKLRLGDTNLYARIEKDYTVYGDECVFGGGKVLREGMGQGIEDSEFLSLDIVITNCVIIDYSGIFKADIGIKNGYIIGLGKAGNLHTMHGVQRNMLIGGKTEVIAGEGMIVTAGAIDCHVHFICPQLVYEAVSSAE